uniref:ORF40 n=1 Tax=Malaco herpesvirus 1 TaxID=3031797 RepID=A0AA48P932_9VIRU|nr:TPA_asm: ORF40 [Malaco herpesvirus 1]
MEADEQKKSGCIRRFALAFNHNSYGPPRPQGGEESKSEYDHYLVDHSHKHERFLKAVETFIEKYQPSQYHISSTAAFFYRKNKPFYFRNGVSVIMEKFGVIDKNIVPGKISDKPGIFNALYPNGIPDDVNVLRQHDCGLRVIKGLIDEHIIQKRRSEGLNSRISEVEKGTTSMQDLIAEGVISYDQINRVQDGMKTRQNIDRFAEILNRPVLRGTISWEHKKVISREPDGTVIFDETKEPVTVQFTGTDDTEMKFKHLWIYSKEPNWGKSYMVINNILKKYRADTLKDPSNAEGVCPWAEIIVIDEYGKNRTMPINQFKCLTGGDASLDAINRKCYGQSHNFLPTTQFIFCSNFSPAEIYAEGSGANKTISKATLDLINSRVDTHRLDGPDEHEVLKWMNPRDLSEDDLYKKIKLHFSSQKHSISFTAEMIMRMTSYVFNMLHDSESYKAVTIRRMYNILNTCVPLPKTLGKLTWKMILVDINQEEGSDGDWDDDFDLSGYKKDAVRKACKIKIKSLLTGAKKSKGFDDERIRASSNPLRELLTLTTTDPKNTQVAKLIEELSKPINRFHALWLISDKQDKMDMLREKRILENETGENMIDLEMYDVEEAGQPPTKKRKLSNCDDDKCDFVNKE